MLDACHTCGGPQAEEGVDFAYLIELPERPRPRVTQCRVWVCQCTVWGKQVRGPHADLALDQYGATTHRWGGG
jgi:hypothetical protein